MGEKVEICGVILSSSYEMPLIIIKESVIKGYHAHMNDWTPILGENLSTRPKPENEIDKYAVAVTKDARVIGHLKKGKTGRYCVRTRRLRHPPPLVRTCTLLIDPPPS